MAVEFRCEKCGKLLNVDAAPDAEVKCPFCKAKVLVPAGVASLPRPQVPPGSVPPPAPSPVQEEPEQIAPAGEDAVMRVMAAIMPWLISALLHAGVGVILAFLLFVVIDQSEPIDYSVVSDQNLTDTPGGVVDPGETHKKLTRKSPSDRSKKRWSQRDATLSTANMGETKNQVRVFGAAGGGGAGQAADFGMTTGGSGAGPKSRFFGTGGNAYHIVYVVDRSGSMTETFEEVRSEIFRSITRLSPKQTFHVIFFATGTPKENPPRRLVQADMSHKREAARYLKSIQPHGQTDPIPALERAFAVLKSLPGRQKKGKLVYLLTDGDFPDNEKVLRRIRELNPRRDVTINTILHHFVVPGAMKVLKAIADENRGKFKFVEPNE